MKLAKHHLYLMFDIHNQSIKKIGEVALLIHKSADIEKWKNPHSLEEEVIKQFKTEHSEYKDFKLTAYYTGDLIPKL